MTKKILAGVVTAWIVIVSVIFVWGFVQKQQAESSINAHSSSANANSSSSANSNSSGSSSVNNPPQVPDSSTAGSYTLAQVAKHGNQNDCWLAVNGSIYNVTSFLSRHPGGAEIIIENCGKDATAPFQAERKHGRGEAQQMLAQLKIGSLAN